jgi:hypothetical protein
MPVTIKTINDGTLIAVIEMSQSSRRTANEVTDPLTAIRHFG